MRSLLLLSVLTLSCTAPPKALDAIIRNAHVATMDEGNPRAEVVGIRDGRIAWLGSNDDARGLEAPIDIDAEQQLLLPGFIDSHNHIKFGVDPNIVKLHHARTFEEIRDIIVQFASDHPDLAWIEGEGWNYTAFPNGELPTANDLDGLTGGRPAFLTSYDVHTAWLNREALALLEIDANSVEVPFGRVEKDPDTGEPTGMLLDFATLGLSRAGAEALGEVRPSRTAESLETALRRALKMATSLGITTLVDPQVDPEDLPMFERVLADEPDAPRVHLALFHPNGTTAADRARFIEARDRLDSDRLRVSALKLYIDDVIEPHTAAMLEPYADAPGESGHTLYPPDEFAALVTELDAEGFQLLIHAIGDRGIRVALDALERARETNGPRDARHQLVHVECLSPDDIARFAELNVVACMQPRHLAPDITGQWARAVGPERSRYAWALRSLSESGARLAFASDYNVAEMDPLVGIYTALTRQGLDGEPDGGWVPEETIDLETALRGYTEGGAFANFVDSNRGTIEIGKYADLVLISPDLFDIEPDAILDAKVKLTMIGGRIVYRAEEPPR